MLKYLFLIMTVFAAWPSKPALGEEVLCPVLGSGGGKFADGTLTVLGQQVVGVVDASGVTAKQGAVYCWLLLDVLGDCDGDGDIDAADYADFVDCLLGPSSGLMVDCDCSDLDGDGDVDLRDFAALEISFTN